MDFNITHKGRCNYPDNHMAHYVKPLMFIIVTPKYNYAITQTKRQQGVFLLLTLKFKTMS